jgi:hypothetical protein
MGVEDVPLGVSDDEATVEAVGYARGGDTDAIWYLWVRYGDALREELERRGVQPARARALALIAFCDLPQSLSAFKHQESPFLEWSVWRVLAHLACRGAGGSQPASHGVRQNEGHG